MGANLGVSPVRLTESIGLSHEDLSDPYGRIEYGSALGLWMKLSSARPKLPLGLHLAHSTRGWGALALAAYHARTGFEALKLLCDYSGSISSHGKIIWDIEGESVVVSIVHVSEVEDLAFPIDYSLAILSQLLLVGFSPRELERVSFKHRAMGSIDSYRDRFGVAVNFSESLSALWIKKEILEAPRENVDPQIPLFLKAHLEQSISRLPIHRKSFRQVLKEELNGLVRDRTFAVETLASRLGMSVRSLQRKAREENVIVSIAIDEAKKELALALLSDPILSVAMIADQLEYADERSFSRAFIRWTGMSPAQWRRGNR
ncbi:MAG: AraC family transcriptional regulator ligand-binding domain-containing protein [Verrucomicrobiota bacterium]